MSFLKENKTLLIGAGVILAVYILYCYNQSRCNCGGMDERFGPKYKKPTERFTHNSRAYEMGPERERFSMDFNDTTDTPPLQSQATQESPFLGQI
jgi:hypothetical protein